MFEKVLTKEKNRNIIISEQKFEKRRAYDNKFAYKKYRNNR